MSNVIVQKEIKVEKCEACNQDGRVIVTGLDGGQYSPFCPCSFGEWKKSHSELGDMFYTNRRG